MCRSKDLSSLPINPVVPAIYRLSPVNPKAHDIQYPEDNKKVKLSRGRKSTSSIQSRRTSDFLFDRDQEEESETLISCMTSFSDEFYLDHSETIRYLPKPIHNDNTDISRSKVSSVRKVQRSKKTTVMSSSSSKASMRMLSPRNMEGRVVKESFAVVKKSNEPYQDFKKSMLEMIMEMEISEAEDLEQLLQCFLALNSRSYHEVIVRAFMEIWQQMFIWNPATSRTTNLQTRDVIIDLEE
ncbi:hypothetical protein RIF29_12801 [Crotalaria pallida]|uniref:Transcription repressor n=1 Tax=Crotalaria pallida TaxID=3830 RepID=A0AAN9INN3_CROPI